MTLTSYLTYASALAIAAAIPGPGVTALIGRALGSGFRSSLFMAFGLLLGDLFYLTAAILGLAMLAQTFGTAFLVIKWLGVVYLTWLAVALWRAGGIPASVNTKTDGGFAASFLAGLTLTLGNPKTMIFYLAITPTLVDLRAITLADYVALTVLTAVVLITVLVPYLALAAKARFVLKSPRMLKVLNRVGAAFMGGAAVAIAARTS